MTTSPKDIPIYIILVMYEDCISLKPYKVFKYELLQASAKPSSGATINPPKHNADFFKKYNHLDTLI